MNERLMREKLLFRYSGALERGDFETIASVLAEAERDPVLEQMIVELNEAYGADLPAPRRKETLPMTTTVMTLERQRPLRFSVALVASAAALILVIGLLAFGGDTRLSPPPQGNEAALLQSGTSTPTPVMPATATPIPAGAADGLSVIACVTPTSGTATLWSQPATATVPTGLVVAGTTIALTGVHVSEPDPSLVLRDMSDRVARGEVPPYWFFGWAQVDDALVQGWVLPNESFEIVECPSPEEITVAVPAVPPLEFVPTLVPTSTPFPAVDPMLAAATAIINDATATAAGGDVTSTATPFPMTAVPFDSAQAIAVPQRSGALVCITPKPNTMATVRSLPSLDTQMVSRIDAGTPMAVLSAIANDPNQPETWTESVELGGESPLWLFIRAQVGDAVIQGWVLGDEGLEVIECTVDGTLSLPPTVPPPGFAPTLVPTSTPFPAVDPVMATATAIISEAQGDSVIALPPTVVPPAVNMSSVEVEIESLMTTVEALRAQLGTPAPICTVSTRSELVIYSRPAADSHPLQDDPVPAGTELIVTGISNGLDMRTMWYQVETADGAIREGYVPASEVQELTPCPVLAPITATATPIS